MGKHSVRVIFKYGMDDMDPAFELEQELMDAVEASGKGKFDGNEFAMDGSTVEFFMFGPDADALFEVVRPILEMSPIVKDGIATLRYGSYDEDARESIVKVGFQSGNYLGNC